MKNKKDVIKDSETKNVYLCDHCSSDNVDEKKWVNLNTNEITDSCDDDYYFCNDCDNFVGVIKTVLSSTSKVIGFQVVGEEHTENEGKIHPLIGGSSHIYSLSQVDKMICGYNGNWRLLTIWNGDIEQPIVMFEGDPRN